MSTSEHLPGRLPWAGLLALFAAAFLAVTTELLPAGLLPQLSEGLNVSQGRIGFLVTGYAVASCLTAIPVTAALRGLPRRPVLIAVLTGFALLNLVTALSSSYPLTFAARLLAGVMGGTLWAMLVGYAARMVPPERRGRAIAIVSAGITIALCLGIPAGTTLATAFGWRTAFITLAAAAAILAAWVRWKVPDHPVRSPEAALPPPARGPLQRGATLVSTPTDPLPVRSTLRSLPVRSPLHASPVRTPLRRVVTRAGIRVVLGVTVLVLLGHQAVYTYIAPLAELSGAGRTGLVLLVFGLATVVGVWVTGAAIDRYPRPALLTALAMIALAMAALGPAGQNQAVLLIAVAGWGVAFGGVPTLLQAALVNASGAADADVATSMQTTVYNLGIAAGSLTGGLVLETSGPGALPWVALPLLATALVTVAAARRHAFPPPNLNA